MGISTHKHHAKTVNPKGYSQSHSDHEMQKDHESLNRVAISATIHCLTGFAIGEVLGMVIGTAIGLGTGALAAWRTTVASASTGPGQTYRNCHT